MREFGHNDGQEKKDGRNNRRGPNHTTPNTDCVESGPQEKSDQEADNQPTVMHPLLNPERNLLDGAKVFYRIVCEDEESWLRRPLLDRSCDST